MVLSALPAATAVISAAFATVVLLRWISTRKRHHLLWTVGLYAITAAAACQVTGALLLTWPEGLFRLYYFLAGSMVALLGAGTLYLMKQEKVATYFLWVVLALIAADAVAAAATPLASVDLSASHVDVAQREIASTPMRILTGILSIAGAIALLAGAVLSYLSTRRLHNLLILAGTILFSVGGTAAGVAEPTSGAAILFYVGNLGGITLLFGGFLLSRPASAAVPPVAAPAAAASPPS